MMRKVLLLGVLLIILLISIGRIVNDHKNDAAASSSAPSMFTIKVTAAQFSQIQDGMTYQQVVKIIGDPGEEMSSSNIAGIKTVMVGWKNWNGSNMNAMFQNGKLISKAQFGLR